MGGSEKQLVSGDLVRSLMSGQERFAVTGASGWIGRTALELLAGALGTERFHEAVTGFASEKRTVTLRDGTVAHLRPLDQLTQLSPPPTHLLHFAYLTRDRLNKVGLHAYIRANLTITATVVGAIDRFRPLGVYSTSSGAVYGSDGKFVTDVTANPYGALKYLEELTIRRAAEDVGCRSVVTRIFSLSGAYMTKPELYALGDLILQASAGGPIVVRAGAPVERSYCAAADVVSVALTCLLDSSVSNDLVFDSGGVVVEVGELARHVRSVLGRPELVIDRSWNPSGPPNRYVGDGAAMSALAAEHGLPVKSLDEQIRDTAAYLESSLGDLNAPVPHRADPSRRRRHQL